MIAHSDNIPPLARAFEQERTPFFVALAALVEILVAIVDASGAGQRVRQHFFDDDRLDPDVATMR